MTTFLLFILIITIGVLIFMGYNVMALITGAPYVPVPSDGFESFVSLLSLRDGDQVIDLGAGTGRISFALTKTGAIITAVELNPILVCIGKIKVLLRGDSAKRIHFSCRNFWTVPLGSYDAIVMYCIPYQMARLSKKIQEEMRPGSRVATYGFRFPDWEPVRQMGKVYLYVLGEHITTR